MAEPWLDSLSEDWTSERHSSSPSAVAANRSGDSLVSVQSQSRIPHLRQNLHKESVNGNYLQPRSARGLARSKTPQALAERNPASLNVLPQTQYTSGSEKRNGASTLPRRVSLAFSDSQNSVQHYTLHHRSQRGAEDTIPEWKRRLARGENVAAEGLDLFGPSKLEGIFRQPSSKDDSRGLSVETLTRQQPWASLNNSSAQTVFERPQTYKTSRGKVLDLEVLQEVNNEDTLERTGSVRGLVKERVKSLELKEGQLSHEAPPQTRKSKVTMEAVDNNDPRWRTVSGQEELRNEGISPVTVSKQNTIRDRALRQSLDFEADVLGSRLKTLNANKIRRPSETSSGQATHHGRRRHSSTRDDSNVELTTHSLPEDLSMGTQEFVSNGGYINSKRGAYKDDDSFLRKTLSSSAASSHPHSRRPSYIPANVRSSPPPYHAGRSFSPEASRLTMSLPTTPSSASVVRNTESSSRPLSSGSPLKLFGIRDTYTNNKLLRVLSQFEGTDSNVDNQNEGDPVQHSQEDVKFGMSQFGKGDLDGFDFSQTVERQKMEVEERPGTGDRIFKSTEVVTTEMTVHQGHLARPTVQSQNSFVKSDSDTKAKRTPDSPRKDRTPKRRRTLLQNELQIPRLIENINVEPQAETAQFEYTKVRDLRFETTSTFAKDEILASRTLLRPRTSRRRSSAAAQEVLSALQDGEGPKTPQARDADLTEALAAELASFANGVTQAVNDSRKPSLATKDYMEEANKVMQFIRAKGKPKTTLPNIEEPTEVSELDPDKILDLDVDDESTKDSFSRPPSREGARLPPPSRRQAQHDPRVASHLRRYQDQDDLELLASTSVLGMLQLVDNDAADEAALVPVPDDEQESSPPNMRILNYDEPQRKRKHSTSTMDRPSFSHHDALHHTQSSSDNSTRRTFPTASSSSSGHKGMITHGTVSIPDHVGIMIFDHNKKIWVKETTSAGDEELKVSREKYNNNEEDPFEHISDLTVDEKKEVTIKTSLRADRLDKRQEPRQLQERESQAGTEDDKHSANLQNSMRRLREHHRVSISRQGSDRDGTHTQDDLHPRISQHELHVHDGIPSQAPQTSEDVKKQPRAVTITFSSPLVSAIAYDERSVSEAELDERIDLPSDESDVEQSSPVTNRADKWAQKVKNKKAQQEQASRSVSRHEQYRAMTLNRRPVSRISEHEEEEEANVEMSLVHVKEVGAVTPATRLQDKAVTVPRTTGRNSSIIALTPLSEFTLHQVDNVRHPEHSYVEHRAHPKSLRQAHGSMALAVDDLVKAITDAEQSEIFWEQIRRLKLDAKGLKSTHGLAEYCTMLEELTIRGNQIGQLNGLPSSIRTLDVHGNLLTNMTSWGHLQNLQYVDVSGNRLDSLDGFSSLVHLRELNASDNKIRIIEGILDLDGLLKLNLSGNDLSVVDFEGAGLNRLAALDLSRNHLVDMQNLQYLPALEEVDVSANDLRSLSVPTGTTLTRLRVLCAADNHLESLELGQFPALERLDLDRNRIRQIVCLSDARQLQTLSLREQEDAADIVNSVLSTPNECCELYLSSNTVLKGQIGLPQLPHYNLQHLELACCGISSLPNGFGDVIPNCRTLNLNFNALRGIEALQGCVRMEKLYLAGNRLKRLRRTCIVLGRLSQNLMEVDSRENPLTAGWYAPVTALGSGSDAHRTFVLASAHVEKDGKWRKLMDETAGLKRRMVELMLAEQCPRLARFNGLPFHRAEIISDDATWHRLNEKGVIAKVIVPTPDLEMGTERVTSDGDVHVPAFVEERSVMIE